MPQSTAWIGLRRGLATSAERRHRLVGWRPENTRWGEDAMPEQEHVALRKIVWSEVFPWLNLVRCFRIAVQLRLLACGALGLLVMLSGWSVLGFVFSGNPAILPDADPVLSACPWLAGAELIGDRPGVFGLKWGVPPGDVAPILPSPGRTEAGSTGLPGPGRATAFGQYEPAHPFWGVWELLSAPWRNLFDPNWTPASSTDRLVRFVFLLLNGLWALSVWAVFGGIITRAAAIELATYERAKTIRSIRYVASRWRAYFAAPFFPLLGVLLIGLPVAIVGLLLRLELTGWVAAILWPLLLLSGWLMALLLLGLLFGWPLMWANISVEGVDSFDAVGRAYNYVFQRPLHYLFYALVASLLGALGWLLVWNFVAAVVALTYGAAAWGAGPARMAAIVGRSPDLGVLGTLTAGWIAFWVQGLKLLGTGFLFSYFWTASTAIYYLLRHDADATEMDEVCPEEEPSSQPAEANNAGPATSPGGLPESQAE
jgi:hypothetical protein